MKINFKDTLKLRHTIVSLLAAWLLIVLGCASIVPVSVESYYPKASPDATKLITLQSNKQKTSFYIDEKLVVKGKRVRVLVSDRPHTVKAQPEGYVSKEEYIQPPYDKGYTVGFYYLIEDQIRPKIAGTPPAVVKVPEKLPPTYPVPELEEPLFQAKQYKNRFALVIGVENYKDCPKAEFACNDAREMNKYAQRLMGIPRSNVKCVLDANLTDIKKYLEGWLPKMVASAKNAFVFFYYSGHGAPDPDTNEAYLVPADGDPQYTHMTCYPLNKVYETLRGLGAKETVAMLDACYSGRGGRSVIASGARPLIHIKLPRVKTENLAVVTASRGDQISQSLTEKKHGILTYAFFKCLRSSDILDKDDDGWLSLKELTGALKRKVREMAASLGKEQEPMIEGSLDIRLAEAVE